MNTETHFKAQGFSLTEMLSVIAVIGIISAIAVPNIGNINGSATIAKDKRNAQNLASVFASAQAAGLDFYGSDLSETIGNVVAGGNPPEGVLADSFFGLPSLSESEQTGASEYLTLSSDSLIYDPENSIVGGGGRDGTDLGSTALEVDPDPSNGSGQQIGGLNW